MQDVHHNILSMVPVLRFLLLKQMHFPKQLQKLILHIPMPMKLTLMLILPLHQQLRLDVHNNKVPRPVPIMFVDLDADPAALSAAAGDAET